MGAKSPYVIKTEFEAALLISLVSYLKTRYGAEWQKALSIYQSGDIGGLIRITQSDPKSCARPKKNIRGENASRFYGKLMDSISDKKNHG
ncbi:MAG: hypothetical protein ABIQ40_00710 [Bacteroidia bacterium]